MSERSLEDNNKDVVRRFVEAINQRDFDRLDELAVPNLVRHCQATPDVHVRSLEDLKRYLRSDFEVFPDAQQTIRMLVAEGDLVAVYAGYSATQKGRLGPFPPSGRRMNIDFSGILRLEEGRVAEIWITWDNMAALEQLGHVLPHPED